MSYLTDENGIPLDSEFDNLMEQYNIPDLPTLETLLKANAAIVHCSECTGWARYTREDLGECVYGKDTYANHFCALGNSAQRSCSAEGEKRCVTAEKRFAV